MADERQPEDLSSVSEEPLTKEVRGFTYRRSEDFHIIYANSVRFATAPWDFSLVFGQTIVDRINDAYIEDKVTITLSPQTAKAMADILNKNLAEYERQFGQIRYTPLQPQTEKSSPPQRPTDDVVEGRRRRRMSLKDEDTQA